eukprot:3634898-Rhodomonas_salina.1
MDCHGCPDFLERAADGDVRPIPRDIGSPQVRARNAKRLGHVRCVPGRHRRMELRQSSHTGGFQRGKEFRSLRLCEHDVVG